MRLFSSFSLFSIRSSKSIGKVAARTTCPRCLCTGKKLLITVSASDRTGPVGICLDCSKAHQMTMWTTGEYEQLVRNRRAIDSGQTIVV